MMGFFKVCIYLSVFCVCTVIPNSLILIRQRRQELISFLEEVKGCFCFIALGFIKISTSSFS